MAKWFCEVFFLKLVDIQLQKVIKLEHDSSISLIQSAEIGSQYTSVYIKKVDADSKNQERRGSYVQPLTEDVPLTHKTGTVGIVALAIRNKNEKKKETEFKVKGFDFAWFVGSFLFWAWGETMRLV